MNEYFMGHGPVSRRKTHFRGIFLAYSCGASRCIPGFESGTVKPKHRQRHLLEECRRCGTERKCARCWITS